MNNILESLLVLIIVMVVAVPVGVVRNKLYKRFVQAREAIAGSFKKLWHYLKK